MLEPKEEPIEFNIEVISPSIFLNVVPKERTARKRSIPWKLHSPIFEKGHRAKRRKRVRPYNPVCKIPVKFDKQFSAYLADPQRDIEIRKTIRSSRALSWFMDFLTLQTFTDDDISTSNLIRSPLCM
ncbi:hypothetical protein IC582_001002 [Cucumis melo]